MATVIPDTRNWTLFIQALGYGYVNHSDAASDANGNLYIAVTGAKSGAQDTIIVKRERGTGSLSVVHIFDTITYGKQGYASLAVVGLHLVVIFSARQDDGSTLPESWIILNVVS